MRRKIVFLNFHPAFYPPKSGGELRYWNLATRVAETFDVVMINPTFGEHEREEIQHAENCREIRVPKNSVYNGWHGFLDRAAKFQECSGLVSLLSVRKHPEYLAEVERETADADIVVHSSPFVFPAYPEPKVNSKGEKQLFIYDSYNIESRLAKESLGGGLYGRWGTWQIARNERKLCERADLILACSHEDASHFVSDYSIDESKFIEIPNGADSNAIAIPNPAKKNEARERLELLSHRPAALFFGSFHPPNIEAAQFIIREIAPQIQGIDFMIAGKVCDALHDMTDLPNVHLLGLVSDEQKNDLLAACDMALNPMFSGSGTNLKMLEFMAAGLAIITTPLGARGLDLQNDHHATVIEPHLFPRAVEELSADPEKRKLFRQRVRKLLVEKFDWNVIGDRLRHLLEIKSSRRLLLLNDYPMSPVTAGGKIRLEALGKQLTDAGHAVTLMTLTTEKKVSHQVHHRGFEEINIPRSSAQRNIDRINAALVNCSVDDIMAGVHTGLNRSFTRAAQREIPRTDLVLLNHCYMSLYAEQIRGEIPLIYESHNAEALLKEKLLPEDRSGKSMIEKARMLETKAIGLSSAVTCVSARDKEEFVTQNIKPEAHFSIAPNGVDCSSFKVIDSRKRPEMRKSLELGTELVSVFLGSGHPPNAEAVRFLMEDVAPKHPAITFLIVGNVCGWFHSAIIPGNVVMMGEVSTKVKDTLLRYADVALNPLFTGSGSSLKVPEYLRAGLPVLSTTTGARGFLDYDESGIVIVEREDFSEALGKLELDNDRRHELADHAAKAARNYFDWPVVLEPLLKVVGKITKPGLPDTDKPDQSSEVNKAEKAETS